MKIVAFDLGATFAWAHNMREPLRWGHKELSGVRPHRLGLFAAWLEENSRWLMRADVIVYETPFARGRDATRSLWGMAGVLEGAADGQFFLPVVDVAVPTIKKFATGRGSGAGTQKIHMIAAARRMGYRGSNEHEADAYCLLKYAEENLERGDTK